MFGLNSEILALAAVGGFAVVQSLFGVGLLVFGTPTLLLVGFAFPEALSILLPASLVVSLLQLWRGPRGTTMTLGRLVWCLVPLVAALAVVLRFRLGISPDIPVALLLATFVYLRLRPTLGDRARGWVARNQRAWLALTGIAHGVSNLGGAPLLVFASSVTTRKEETRALVATCYAWFAAAQLVVLTASGSVDWRALHLLSASLAGLVFLTLGQPVFVAMPAPAFNRFLTALAAAYSAVLGLRGFGVL